MLLQKKEKSLTNPRETNQKQNESTSSESEVNDRKRERWQWSVKIDHEDKTRTEKREQSVMNDNEIDQLAERNDRAEIKQDDKE